MDEVSLLVKALIRENAYELLIENRKYLEFAITVLDEQRVKALDAVIEYTAHIGRCPENFDSVIHFVKSNRNNLSKFEKTEGFELELEDIANSIEEEAVGASVLINNVYQQAHDLYLARGYAHAAKITAGASFNIYSKDKESGSIAADAYLQEHKSRLVEKKSTEVGGELKENISYMRNYLNQYIIGESKRVFTGFRKIDEVSLIGKKQPLKWIGILGYTHHGKSLFLASLLYNMACHGANIMLCPRESSVEDAWMGIIWLHHQKVCPDRPISSRKDWMRIGSGIGKDKYDTIQLIMDDLENGNTLPGKFFVYPCNTWGEIEDKLQATNKKNKYDVLAIDYFAHLDPEGSGRESDIDKQKKSLRKAQMLSQNGIEDDKSGLVIITPLQANKKGYEEAAKQEGDDYGIYKSPMAVEYFTQAAQDMDLLMSVWFEGDSCKEVTPNQMIVHCLKGRNDMRFPTHRLEIHPETGFLTDLGNSKPIDIKADLTDLSDIDANELLFTKTSLNTDSWST